MTTLPPGRQKAPRLGLLGGSFNPAHEGHREISLEAIKLFDLDAVWWLVSPANPLKDPAEFAPYSARLTRAREVARHPRIVISNFEDRFGLQYTVDTLQTMRDLSPGASIIWLMGADSLAGFHRWKDWRRICELVPIAVFNRPGYGPGEVNDALRSEAAEALEVFRLNEDQAGDLPAAAPPAWTFIASTRNPESATEHRKRAAE